MIIKNVHTKLIVFSLASLLMAGLVLISVNCSTQDNAAKSLPADINELINQEKYSGSSWGVLAADLETGEVVYSLNTSELFIPASVTKLISTAAAMHYLGADYVFKTPVYKTGDVSDGALQGDLILVASGDPTMGGRTTPDNKIAFENFDHSDANALPYATLTKEDPLAGLDNLAKQVKAKGINSISGDVVIDNRLFETMEKDEYVLSPIMINDNMIDLIIDPTVAGQPATVDFRPEVPGYTVTARVETIAAGEELDIQTTSDAPGQIVVEGQIPEDQGELIRTFQVLDPAPFARTLFIQALQNNGITVGAPVSGDNPANLLPDSGSYQKDDQLAELVSPPLSEDIKLTNKVSQNMHADNLIEMIAVNNGTPGFEEGMQLLVPFLEEAGVDTNSMALSDGRGGGAVGLFSPEQITTMLRYMATRDDFESYKNSLPILGVDGSFAIGGVEESPADGKIWAKTGTSILEDVMHDRAYLMSKALSGYIEADSGRELVFAIFVNHAPLNKPEDVIEAHKDLIRIAEIIYNQN